MTPSLSELVAVALEHYPLEIPPSAPGYWAQPESVRRRSCVDGELAKALTKATADVTDWFPRRRVWDHTILLHDAARRIRLPTQEQDEYPAVFVCFSILGPYWIAYASLSPDDARVGDSSERWSLELTDREASEAASLVARVESVGSLALQSVPAEHALHIVPGVSIGNLMEGRARILDLLFTSDRW